MKKFESEFLTHKAIYLKRIFAETWFCTYYTQSYSETLKKAVKGSIGIF